METRSSLRAPDLRLVGEEDGFLGEPTGKLVGAVAQLKPRYAY